MEIIVDYEVYWRKFNISKELKVIIMQKKKVFKEEMSN